MNVSGEWLHDPATQRICAMLTGAGHKALFVGGCIRNELLGVPVGDVDIATDATPQTVMKLAAAAKIKALPTGLAHGTVTLVSGGVPHEITTFRKDVATDGRRAVVAFSTDIRDDAARRDFTMNALYATPDGAVQDPLGGLADLQAGRVRFIGDAEARIAEDYLRILRFFRLNAWYGNQAAGFDAAGLAACARNAPGITRLSRERVGAEIRKMLSAENPVGAVMAMAGTGVLEFTLPGASPALIGPLVGLERSGGFDLRWLRRLAALGADTVAAALRLSRAEEKALAAIRAVLAAPGNAAQLAQRFGATAAIDGTLVNCARDGTPVPNDLQAAAVSGAQALFPLRAADLAGIIENGLRMGRILKELREIWIQSGMRRSKAQLLSDISRLE